MSTLMLAFAALVFLRGALAITVTPFSDSQCTKKIDASTRDWPAPYEFPLGGGVRNVDNGYGWWPEVKFPGASTTGTASGVDVWWHVDDIDTSCRVAIGLPYTSVSSYGKLAPSLGIQMPGNIVINAGTPGCYYSHVPIDSDLWGSFCCGTDCSVLAVSDAALISRDIEPESEPEKRKALSPAALAAAVVAAKRAVKTCTVTNLVDNGLTEGFQHAISNTVVCPDVGTCIVNPSYSLALTSSMSVEKSQTTTNSIGESVTVSAGIEELGLSFGGSETTSYEHAKAITKGTSTAVGNGTTSTLSYSLSPHLGTRAFLSFTPLYHCFTADSDCGNGEVLTGVNLCNPEWLNAKNDGTDDLTALIPAGDYNWVYVS